MKRLETLNYGIVGLGIMGGSFARAIRDRILSMAAATGEILVTNRSPAPVTECLKDGVADKGFSFDKVDEMLGLCDLTFICLPPKKTLDFLLNHKDAFKCGSIVTDISGVKGIYKPYLSILGDGGADFVIGHPMAGGEKEGYSASSPRYFIDHNYIIIPTEFNKKDNLSLFIEVVTALGFSRITETDIDTHDFKIGFTSQLCHVIASALVDCAPDEGITAFGGGSFEDLTRIALINAPLWTELFIENDEKLVSHIERFESSLNKIKDAIKARNQDAIESLLSGVRRKRSSMGTIRTVTKG